MFGSHSVVLGDYSWLCGQLHYLQFVASLTLSGRFVAYSTSKGYTLYAISGMLTEVLCRRSANSTVTGCGLSISEAEQQLKGCASWSTVKHLKNMFVNLVLVYLTNYPLCIGIILCVLSSFPLLLISSFYSI